MWIRKTLRLLGLLLAAALVIAGLIVGGYRWWLSQQSERLQEAIESPGFQAPRGMELLRMLSELVLPPSQHEVGAYGRRPIAGRGHVPWVMRSSLDGRPRMLHFALAPEHWISYATEIGSLYQFWKGDIAWRGAVYDTSHGTEPESRGVAFQRAPDRNGWGFLEPTGETRPARVEYLGHRVSDQGARAALRVRLHAGDAGTAPVEVEETPEILLEAGRTGLLRRFRLRPSGDAGRALPVTLRLPPGAEEVETDGTLLLEDLLQLREGDTRVTSWFGSPAFEIPPRPGLRALLSGAAALIQASDCVTCHGERERVVGPSHREIALRYADQPRDAVVEELARKVLEGGVGTWGPVPMPPHPELTRSAARAMVRAILDMPEGEPLPESVVASADGDIGRYDFDVEVRPTTLHPSLTARRIMPEGFTPKVGGLAWHPDGRLLLTTWDADGAVFAVEGWNGPAEDLRVRRIAEGLHEPLGIATVGDAIYVMQKQELTRLLDHDGDGWTDEYRAVSQAWAVTSNFHEFGFGLVHREGWLYGTLSVCVLPGGKSCPEQTRDRGSAFRVSLADGRFERVAAGFRTPNGVGWLEGAGLLVTDNQGDWLPASKLLLATPGSFHGWRGPAQRDAPLPRADPPIAWLPQNEVGNSPTEPVVLGSGPYRGQVLFGDVYNGGIKRLSLQRVGERWQGAAFHFTAGLEGGVNRLLEAPDGQLVVGEVGSTGNWNDIGKAWFGLELLRFSDGAAFEPFTVEVTAEGLDVLFTRPLAVGSEPPAAVTHLKQWHYIPTEIYGGPKFGLVDLEVREARLSADRRTLHLAIPGIETGHVVYLRLDRSLRSDEGEPLWVNEAWVTVNAIPEPDGA